MPNPKNMKNTDSMTPATTIPIFTASLNYRTLFQFLVPLLLVY